MLAGTLDPAELTTFGFPAALSLADTFVVQAVWEIAGTPGVELLPPALHPTSPTLLSVFAVAGHAQVRLSCRHGARARALVIASTTDVRFDGARLLIGEDVEVGFGERVRALGPVDVQYVTSLWPVDVDGRGRRLVQQELDVEVPVHERWSVTLERWPSHGPRPVHPVGASVARGSVTLPAPRFAARPDVVAFAGSEPL
jgi:hypothetical protein